MLWIICCVVGTTVFANILTALRSQFWTRILGYFDDFLENILQSPSPEGSQERKSSSTGDHAPPAGGVPPQNPMLLSPRRLAPWTEIVR
jgi:hypothetical protein